VKIEDAMSKEIIVGYVPGTVKDALKILAKNNVSGMPVLKKDTKKVVGVVTRTDIFRNTDEDQLALIMNKDFKYTERDQNIKEAAKLLYEHRIHGLPVVNSRKEIIGIISPTDILKNLPKNIDEVVDHYFTNLVVPAHQDTPINIVMEIINITHTHAMPILDDNRKLIGIVTDGDLFKLSHIRESVSHSDMGMGGDEDDWTWEGIRDTVRLHYSTTEVSLPPVPVREVMVEKIIKAYKTTPVTEIAGTMLKNKISHVPVVDSQDHLLGMVTDIDLMACMF